MEKEEAKAALSGKISCGSRSVHKEILSAEAIFDNRWKKK